jgi:chromosome segregation ATPase
MGSSNKSDPMSSTDIDPFVLDFGSSVNISEELYRSICVEIKEIDEEISSLQNEYKSEERIRMQLIKDYSHALTEMNHIGRDAYEDLEQARVRQHLMNHIRDSIEKDITCALVTPASSPTDKSELKNRELHIPNDPNSVSPDVPIDENLSSCAENYKLELKRLSEALKKDHADCVEWKRKIHDLEEECSLIQSKMNELTLLCAQVSDEKNDIRRENLLAKQEVERTKELIEKQKLLCTQYNEIFSKQVCKCLYL